PALLFSFFLHSPRPPRHLHSFPTRRSSDLSVRRFTARTPLTYMAPLATSASNSGASRRRNVFSAMSSVFQITAVAFSTFLNRLRSEEHTSELQSRFDLVCRLLLEKKKKKND